MPLASRLGTGIQGRACRVGTMQDRDQSTLTPPPGSRLRLPVGVWGLLCSWGAQGCWEHGNQG